MRVFREKLTIPRKRANGSPGFVVASKGSTPEQCGLTAEELATVEHQLVEVEGEAATVDMTADEAIDQLTVEQKIAFAIAAMLKEDPKKKSKKLWTRAKEPRVEHIEQMIDANITETQRDEAWANYEKEE